MKVYKFGGASVKDAAGIKNLAHIVRQEHKQGLLVVVSAMGKTTNALEALLSLKNLNEERQTSINKILDFHVQICGELFPENHIIFEEIETIIKHIEQSLAKSDWPSYDFLYDQVVSQGEILSTKIVAYYLKEIKLAAHWIHAKKLIFTNNTYRAAKVDLKKTNAAITTFFKNKSDIFVTQGFIGNCPENFTTTLGREGSDYSAALFAASIAQESVSIWKDVDGVYNADPKYFSNAKLIPYLSYEEAKELTFFGASIIHPKTIKPLEEKNIKLIVRSFYKPSLMGSIVGNNDSQNKRITSIIVKQNQLLLSLSPHDYGFMGSENIALVIQLLNKHQHAINLMQNSARSFSVCVDKNQHNFEALKMELQSSFKLRYNKEQVLISIRNYHNHMSEKIYQNIDFKLEQRNRTTFQIIVNQEEFYEKVIPTLNQLLDQ
ncbi:MAG: aspartate kinase [Bacteroidetes bacterium 4572_77]|nr:MAG: aspartate kinase [Bacteroidetes bacterium 4572_77]